MQQSPFSKTFQAPDAVINEAPAKALWLSDGELAFNHLAFALDQGFLGSVQFFNNTEQIGIRNIAPNDSGTLTLLDPTPEVFEHVRGKFLKSMRSTLGEMTPLPGRQSSGYSRKADITYRTPEDSSKSFRCKREVNNSRTSSPDADTWTVVTVTVASDQPTKKRSFPKKLKPVKTLPPGVEEEKKKTRASSNYEELRDQVRNVIDNMTKLPCSSRGIEVYVHFEDEKPCVEIANLPSENSAKIVSNQLRAKLSGIKCERYSYDFEDNEDLSVNEEGLWAVTVSLANKKRGPGN